MPSISVIVPAYNVENKINRCIDSILSQTYRNFESLLIDDGSVDGTSRKCDQYAFEDERIITVHQYNSGVSVARNIGIELSTSEYLSFVDSDDYIKPEYLDRLHSGINKSDLVICGVYFANDQNDDKYPQANDGDYIISFEKAKEKEINKLIDDRRFNYVYAKLYDASIIKKHSLRFDTDIKIGEDTIFVMDYIKQVPSCYIIGEAYYTYIRYSNGSLVSRFYPDIYKQYSKINKTIEDTFKGKNIDVSEAVNKRYINSSLWATEAILKCGCSKKCKEKMLQDILDSSRLQKVLENENSTYNNPDFEAMQKYDGKQLLKYYQRKVCKEKAVVSAKKAVVKVFPHSWIQKVKQWLKIAA